MEMIIPDKIAPAIKKIVQHYQNFTSEQAVNITSFNNNELAIGAGMAYSKMHYLIMEEHHVAAQDAAGFLGAMVVSLLVNYKEVSNG